MELIEKEKRQPKNIILGPSKRLEKALKGRVKHPKMNVYHTPKAKARKLAKLQRKARRVSYAS